MFDATIAVELIYSALTKERLEDGVEHDGAELLGSGLVDATTDELLPGQQLDHLDALYHLVTLLHPRVRVLLRTQTIELDECSVEIWMLCQNKNS